MSVRVRACEERDLAATAELFNELIPTTTVAWTDVLTSVPERAGVIADHEAHGFPVLVAVDGEDPSAEAVLGVASYGAFRNRQRFEGYRFTVEHSIHVRGDQRGRGIGATLLTALIDHARNAGVHVMVGAIDGDNEDSLRFHERMGFAEVARMPETGFKFGRWLDLVLVQRIL
ncbi:MAG: N-acetyltransferase family protein [Acidimicrobiia bacterium]